MTITQGEFDGKTVIVTGAGSGIGRATAEAFIGLGARVIAADVSTERLGALATALSTARLITVSGDLTDGDDIAKVLAAAGDRIDVLANVAGIMDGFLQATEVDDATWDRVIAVNLTSPARLIRAVLPVMVARRTGAIVNVASEAGLRGSTAGIAYTSSKHAMIGLTKNVALVYAPDGIRTNAIAPGAVATSIDASNRSPLTAERLARYMAIAPAAATAQQLADSIVYLASDRASNINGVVLPSDSGWAAI